MGQLRLLALLLALPVLALPAPATAGAAKGYYECQTPQRTGVAVHDLHGISAPRACPVALELFNWESSSSADQHALYGCHRPKPEDAGYPYLRLRHFRGWAISLRGSDEAFTMSRGDHSFELTGTDFPLDCT